MLCRAADPGALAKSVSGFVICKHLNPVFLAGSDLCNLRSKRNPGVSDRILKKVGSGSGFFRRVEAGSYPTGSAPPVLCALYDCFSIPTHHIICFGTTLLVNIRGVHAKLALLCVQEAVTHFI